MLVIEQVGHERVGGSNRGVLEAASVGRDPLVSVDGKELCTRERSRSEQERMNGKRDGKKRKKKTCIV